MIPYNRPLVELLREEKMNPLELKQISIFQNLGCNILFNINNLQ
jgi:hypothetical protein